MIIYYCLRLMLGPVIESLVLADRCLYLIEEGKQFYSLTMWSITSCFYLQEIALRRRYVNISTKKEDF